MKKRRKLMKGRIRKNKKKKEWKSLAVGRKVGLWIVTGKCLGSRAGYGHMGKWKTCSKKMFFSCLKNLSNTHISPTYRETYRQTWKYENTSRCSAACLLQKRAQLSPTCRLR